jgi:Cytochrome c biogenesis factor
MVVFIAVAAIQAEEQLNVLMSEGKFAKAIEYVDYQISAASRTVEIWLAYAEALERTQPDKQKSFAALTEAQKVNPSDPHVYAAIGDFYARQKNYQEAIKYYQKWYVLDRNAKAAEGIAVCAARLKIWDKAKAAAESAVMLDSTTLESRKILSVIYFNDKDYADAAQQLEAIVMKVKDDVNYWKKLARCYEESKNREKLMAAASHIVDLDKKDIPSRRLLSDYALEKNDQVTAYNLLKELALLTPEDPKVFKHLYEISTERGQKKDAAFYFHNFWVLDSSDAKSYKAIGGMRLNTDISLNYTDDLKPIIENLKTVPEDQKKWLFIIAVENYDQSDPVLFSKNSAEEFKIVAQKVFGISGRNTYSLIEEKATSGAIKDKLEYLITRNVKEGDFIYFYYSGHGVPDPSSGESYILPKDKVVDFINHEPDFALTNIYKKLTDSKASKVIAFIDACFSGKTDNISLFKGTAPGLIRSKEIQFDNSKMALFCAGKSTQFSNSFIEKGHRMFSYYLIKSLATQTGLTPELLYKDLNNKVKASSLAKGDVFLQEPQIYGNIKLGLY